MKRKQLANLFARASRRSPARAADEIDTLVYRMLKELKRPAVKALTDRPSPTLLAEAKQVR